MPARKSKLSSNPSYFSNLNNQSQGHKCLTKGGHNSNSSQLHPIDQRLAEMGKSRNWLGQQVGRSTSCIKGYCDRKVIIKPGSVVCKRICQVLEIDLNFLYLGQRSTTPILYNSKPEQRKAGSRAMPPAL